MEMTDFKFIIGILIFTAGMVHGYYGVQKTRRESRAVSRRNLIERILILSVFMVWVILTAFYLFSSLLDYLTLHFSVWLRWIGIFTLFAGDTLLVLAHFALGKNWSLNPEIRDEHTLVVDGIYRFIRHPMYTAYVLIGIGFLLSSANLLVSFLFILPIAALSWFRIGTEEKMMSERFGNEYQEYAKRTGRFLPKIRL